MGLSHVLRKRVGLGHNRGALMGGACAVLFGFGCHGGAIKRERSPSYAQAPKAAPAHRPLVPAAQEAFRDPARSIAERVAALLAQMTLAEKVAQVCIKPWPAYIDPEGRLDPVRAREVLAEGLGITGLPADKFPPSVHARMANEIQSYLRSHTRLGIPALLVGEGLHGALVKGGTHFPQALALASTWDPAFVRRVYEVVGREMRALGRNVVLAPVVDVGREPRWGRTEETFGEDPYLVGRMGLAAVQGLQGEALLPGSGIDKQHVASVLKHFAGHGAPEGGRNAAPANLGLRHFREVHLGPFETLVKGSAVMGIMASYNEVDGIPSHANRWLLTDVLRGEWGFSGFVLADSKGIAQLRDFHGVAETVEDAARMALWAGVDLELANRDFAYPTLAAQVEQGRVSVHMLDQAVARVLRAKFLLGLFEDPLVLEDEASEVVGAPAHLALAQDAAERALILLKNEHQALPLDVHRVRRLAVIGPNAADIHLGAYSAEPREGMGVREGLERYARGRFQVTYAEGVRIVESEATFWKDGEVTAADPQKNLRRIQEAVRVARRSDAVVLVLGDNETTSREAWEDDHLGDRDSLTLLGDQVQLAEAIVATRKPVVALVLGGRPLDLSPLHKRVDAVLQGWYLGQNTGLAVARVLFGDVNPGGKTPITFPRGVGQLPATYDHKPSRVRRYLGADEGPLYPFGHGLSYTTFAVGAPLLGAASITTSETAVVTVEVTNTGSRPGDEVVQLYVRDQVASVTRPVKELEDFARVHLEPGETQTVTFRLPARALAFFGRDVKRAIEPGRFDVLVGPNSKDLEGVELEVRAPPR